MHSPLRTGFSDAMVWIDGHTDWTTGTPTVKPPINGEGNWEMFFHEAEKTCPLCPPAPEQHKAAAPKSHAKK